MIEDFELFPLPPAWRHNASDMTYINEDTGEVSTIHPYQRVLDKRAAAEASKYSSGHDMVMQDGLGHMREDGADGPLFVDASTSVVSMEQNSAGAGSQMGAPIRDNDLKKRMKGQKYSDFRCLWKEFGLMGETNSYGLVIRYYPDGQTVIKFDGVEGIWHLSQLMGPYGPVDRCDLFVGAKVTVFGRHLSIASTGASTCRWIEEEGLRLSKQQEWLQQRVESVGAVPCVQREPPKGPLQHQGRSGKPAGSDNLRMLTVNNAKLAEQLAQLGMAHCVAPSFYSKTHKATD
jgi:hypothetical protein